MRRQNFVDHLQEVPGVVVHLEVVEVAHRAVEVGDESANATTRGVGDGERTIC